MTKVSSQHLEEQTNEYFTLITSPRHSFMVPSPQFFYIRDHNFRVNEVTLALSKLCMSHLPRNVFKTLYGILEFLFLPCAFVNCPGSWMVKHLN